MMNIDEIKDIKACLPDSRTIFYYYKDRYAVDLLAAYVDTPKTMRDLKKSAVAGLLRKPLVQQAVAQCANGLVDRDALQSAWPADPYAFLLTIGAWGHNKASTYYQTSRTGHNLVLHLNFSNQHDSLYQKALSTPSRSPFLYSSHPHAGKGRNTLAWARMDIDMERGEALIEEVQNDWLREAREDRKRLVSLLKTTTSWSEVSKQWPFNYEGYAQVKSIRALTEYLDGCIQPYERIWDEAMLYAAIWFLREELGIKRIFYNTWATGCRMKGIEEQWAPPRSIYTRLPRRFCFQEGGEYPEMVHPRVKYIRRKWKHHSPRWFQLAV